MYLCKVKIQNFRLLENVELTFHKESTLIVGKNNSGKTSLNEIFRKINNLNKKLSIEDFNINTFEKFFDFFNQEAYDDNFELPEVSITFYLNYDNDSDLAVLSDFIIDLDVNKNYVKILVKYSIKISKKEKFYESGKKLAKENKENNKLIVFLKKELTNFFEYSVISIDPTDKNNTKDIANDKYKNLIQNNFIFAQRELDDNTHGDSNILSKVLFDTVENKDLSADDIENHIQSIQSIAINDLDSSIKTHLLPKLKYFGYPGLNDPNIQTEL